MNRSSISDYDNEYLRVCDLAVTYDYHFDNFKNNPAYMNVLEHVSDSQGEEYLKIISNQSLHFLEKIEQFKENDNIGNPRKSYFETVGYISPTTLRYIKVASDLEVLFGSLDDCNIIEIGCGYGGQSKVLMDLYSIDSYSYVDLSRALNLTEKYMNKFDYSCEYMFTDISQDEEFFLMLDNYDLVISNYAFSECVQDVQELYIDQILNQSDLGYMTCNFISDEFNIKSFDRNSLISNIEKDIKIKEEVPLTHPNNCILYWGSDV